MQIGKSASPARKTRPLARVACLARAVLSCLVLLAAGAQAAYAAEGGFDPRDLSGVWWTKTYTPKIEPGSTAVIFTPESKARYDRNIAGLKDGSVVDAARRSCAPDGVPRIMAAPYPFQIAQMADRVTLTFEVNNAVRTVTMDRPLPALKDLAPAPLGHSYGHWERDTLVVDTAGFTEDTFLDATGLPHSDQLNVREYFWRSGPGGNQLQYVARVLDPKTFTEVWVQRHVYERRSDIQIAKYACGGKNRDISQVAGASAWK